MLALGQKNYVLVNPFPKLTSADVHKRAGVALRRLAQGKRPEFVFTLEHEVGALHSSQSLAPGEKHIVPQQIGEAMKAKYAERGLVVFPEAADEEEQRDAWVEALMSAKRFYNANGEELYNKEKDLRGEDDAKAKQFHNGRYASFVLNMAREKIVEERLSEILKSAQKD